MAKSKAKLKIEISERANGLCEYCKCPSNASTSPFVIEHIIPKSKNGDDTLSNLAFSCSGCNGHKYNKTTGKDPKTGLVENLFHPRHQTWNEHFKWSKDCVTIKGISAIGRATILSLQLNRLPVQTLRKAFIVFGTHPPK